MKSLASVTHIDHTGIFGPSRVCDIATNGEAWITELLIVLHIVTPGHRHIIDNPERVK